MSIPHIMEVDHPDYCTTVKWMYTGPNAKPKLSATATAMVEVGNDYLWNRDTLAAMSSEDRARMIKVMANINADIENPAMELVKINSELAEQLEEDKEGLGKECVKKRLRELEVLGGLMGHKEGFMQAGGMSAGIDTGGIASVPYHYLYKQFKQRGIDYESMIQKRCEDRGEDYYINKSNIFFFALNESRMREDKGEKVRDDILNGATPMVDEAIKRLKGFTNEDGLEDTVSVMLLKHKDKLN